MTRRPVDFVTGKPSRVYVIFVLAMSFLLVVGTVALIGGAALSGGDDDEVDQPVVETQPGEEIARLQTAVAENPDDTETAAVLANILANSGRLAESIEWYARAVEGDPANGELRLAFGVALLQLGNAFDAAVQLKRAHDLLPDDPSPAYYLGRLNETKRDPDLIAAREWYQTTIDIDPESGIAEQARNRLDELSTNNATPSPGN